MRKTIFSLNGGKTVFLLILSLMLFITFSFLPDQAYAAKKAAAPAKVSKLRIAVEQKSIEVRWKKIKRARKCQIYQFKGKGKWKKVKTVKAKAKRAVVGKLAPGRKYIFKIRGVRGKKKGKFIKFKIVTKAARPCGNDCLPDWPKDKDDDKDKDGDEEKPSYVPGSNIAADATMAEAVWNWWEAQQGGNWSLWSDGTYIYEEAITNEIVALAKSRYGITDKSSDFDKIVYTVIAESDLLSYDKVNPGGYRQKCDGYSKLYVSALNKLDVPCYYVSSKRINHAWNIVKCGGKYYCSDISSLDRHGYALNDSYGYALDDLQYNVLSGTENSVETWPSDCPLQCSETSYYDCNEWRAFYENNAPKLKR